MVEIFKFGELMQPIIKVDLTIGKVSIIEILAEFEREFLGGASLAARMLYDDLTPELDPLSPDSPLLFINGPLSGTAGPAVGRFVICGKSPATNIWGEANCGGFWGPELRKAGFDGLWITGKSTTPVYICIKDGDVEIRDAEHLWGSETYKTQELIQEELGNLRFRIAVIGPAGESLVPYSVILTDHGRVAARTGMGAIMGSKNLKAVAVRGSGSVPVFDLPAYNQIRSQQNRELRGYPASMVLRELGTASVVDYFDYLGEMPKLYFQADHTIDDMEISGANIAEKYLSGITACHACVMACGRVVKLQDGRDRKGPEYETLAGFGPNLGIDDPERITIFGELCDRFGMDTISLSNVLGLAFLLYQEGKINNTDTGGLALEWGDASAVEELIYGTIRRDGIGEIIAQGAKEFGKYFEAEDLAVQVNGLEVPYHDPRGASGMSLVYATSPRGACHNQSDYYFVEVGQAEDKLGLEFFSRFSGAEKALNVAIHQDWRSVFNSLVICIFAFLSPESVLELINSACGYRYSISDMMRCGERGWNLKRVINNRLGISRSNDKLPKALLKPYKISDSRTKGFSPDFIPMLEQYYAVRGWDKETGYPTKEKLETLNLAWTIEDIW
jgi:aldehyde:ferredoxin oxidoreductase